MQRNQTRLSFLLSLAPCLILGASLLGCSSTPKMNSGDSSDAPKTAPPSSETEKTTEENHEEHSSVPKSATMRSIEKLKKLAEQAEKRELTAGNSPTPEKANDSKTIQTLENRVMALEANLSSMHDQLLRTQERLKKLTEASQSPSIADSPVISPPSNTAGRRVPAMNDPRDPDSGFLQNQAIQEFRNARILFLAKKYPESILAFSGFVTQYPDHPFAGNAQYFVAQSYSIQKEYKLAILEFQRLLQSYPDSPHVSEAVRSLVTAYENLGAKEKAEKYRHLLFSIFPHSPAAGKLKDSENHRALNSSNVLQETT